MVKREEPQQISQSGQSFPGGGITCLGGTSKHNFPAGKNLFNLLQQPRGNQSFSHGDGLDPKNIFRSQAGNLLPGKTKNGRGGVSSSGFHPQQAEGKKKDGQQPDKKIIEKKKHRLNSFGYPLAVPALPDCYHPPGEEKTVGTRRVFLYRLQPQL